MSGDEQQRLAAQLNSLTRVSERLSATLLLDDILQHVLQEAVENTGATGGEIVLFDRDELAGIHIDLNHQVPPSTHLDERAMDSKSVVTGRIGATDGVGDALVCPVLFEDSVTGLLRLYRDKPMAFDDRDKTFTTALTNHIALAVGNARRFQELRERNTLLQKRTQQIEHFLASSRVFHSERRLEEVYEELVFGIQEGVGFNVVLLSLVERTGATSVLKRTSAAGLPLERFEELRKTRQSWAAVEPLLLDTYRLGGAYFVPHGSGHAERSRLDIHQVSDLYPGVETKGSQLSKRQTWHENDLFFIPLRDSQGEPLGLISLTAPIDGLRPDLNTARVLEVFANQAASAIENVQLFHSMWDFALQLQQLHNVSQQTLREQDFDQQLAHILDGLQIVGWQRVSLTIRDESRGTMKLVTVGFDDEARQQLQRNLLPTSVWRERLADERFQKLRRGNCFFLPGDEPKANIESLLTQAATHTRDHTDDWQSVGTLYRPLYDRNQRLVGLLALAQPENYHLIDENGLQAVDLYAQFVISVIEGHRLFSEMQRRSQELQVLFDASKMLSGTLKQDAILEAMGEQMLKAVQARSYSVYALTRDRRDTVMVRSNKRHPGQEEEYDIYYAPLQRMKLAQEVIRNNRAVAADFVAENSGVGDEQGESVSVTMLPIPLRDELFGLVEIVAPGPRFSWTPDKLQLLEAIANQAGTALETAHLVEELDDRVVKRTRALAEEVARVQSILESIADGVLVAESSGAILMANVPTARFLSVRRQDLVGKTVEDLIGQYGSGADRWAGTVLDWSAKAATLEQHSVIKDQIEINDRILSVHISPVFANGEFFGTISTFRDVTREAEVDRMKSEFVSNVSHELRTPMTSIKGYTDLLLMGAAGEISPPQLRLLDAIRRNADRLKTLVDDLLDISWIETGRTDLKREIVSIASIIENEIGDHVRGRIQHEDKDIDFSVELEPRMPPLFADPEKITRIIMNLVDNAINYTRDGGEVAVSAAAILDGQREPSVKIRVRDSGVGIAPKHLERIFERFYRVEEDSIQERPGTGLGLSIVRSLVEMHGGEISVESELGVGSTFTVTLPCMVAENEPLLMTTSPVPESGQEA